MLAHVIAVSNPFDPVGSRSMAQLRRPVKVRRLMPRNRPSIALLNGRPLLRAGWRRKLRDGDQLMIVVLPRGGMGGKGGGGSNPFRILLMIVVMVFAPWAAGALGLVAGTITHSLVTLGITMAGMALINKLMPIRQPDGLPSPSPTYSLQAQSNQARLEQAIPVQYGRLKAFPDLAAQPYVEFAADEQYLYQLLCLGSGEYDIEQILIEDTPTTSFDEITWQIAGPGEQITLFPTAVVTSVEVSGQDMAGRDNATWARSGTTVTVTEADHLRAVGQAVRLDFTSGSAPPNGVYAIATVGEGTWTVETETGSGSGNVNVRTVIGGITGFVANPAGTVATRLGIDMIMPRGLFTVEDDELANKSLGWRVQAQRVDDDGEPLGSWSTLATETLTDRSNTPLRRSYSYTLGTPGRYRVRAWRTDVKSTEAQDGHDLMWAGLRAYLTETQDFGPVTLVAMRMRASNNLSMQSSRKVAMLATRKLPIWDGEAWTEPQPTRSIAWALADLARNSDYGGRLDDWRLDLPSLMAMDAIWTERGDEFNGRFDSATTWWDAASRIARAGRARPFFQGGILRMVRDGPASVPVAMFGERNIKKGSFSLEYTMGREETADAVEVTYFDGRVWQPRRVKVALAGSDSERPAKVDMFGITDRRQARREALYIAAANKYRRRIVRFTTEMAGFIPILGDLIAVQHSMPGWGQVAEVVAWDAGTRQMTVNTPLDWSGTGHVLAFRRGDGSQEGPFPVTRSGDDAIAVLADMPEQAPWVSGDGERAHVAFGRADNMQILAKVVETRPRGLYEVEIEAVVEDNRVHTAEDDGEFAGSGDIIRQLPVNYARPVVTGLMAALSRADTAKALLSWVGAPGADSYHVELAEGSDVSDPDVSWTRVADTAATSHLITLLHPSRAMIRVRGMGLLAGPWTAANIGALIGLMWATDETTLMWAVDDTALMWSA